MHDRYTIPKIFRVKVIVERDGDYYYGYCPDLEGIFVQGDTLDETRNLIERIVPTHLLLMIRNNEPLPVAINF